jgi:uncharacterized protein with HEPN domain
LPSKNPALRLQDIIGNARRIAAYIDGLNETAFLESEKTRDAVERCLQRISEAAVKLGAQAAELAPDQPWKDIRGLGNMLRHEYDVIAPDEIWKMASEDVPALARDCEAALGKLTSST